MGKKDRTGSNGDGGGAVALPCPKKCRHGQPCGLGKGHTGACACAKGD